MSKTISDLSGIRFDTLSLGNELVLPAKIFSGMTDEPVSLILVEVHGNEYIFDLIYFDTMIGQVSAKTGKKGATWETF
jgi:hypothetical protein